MGWIDELRQRYDAVREDLEQWLPDQVRVDLEEWASGRVAMNYFGGEADELDALCLLAAHERQMSYVLGMQVEEALYEGRSWNEIAAALGVSRQAARKRFASSGLSIFQDHQTAPS